MGEVHAGGKFGSKVGFVDSDGTVYAGGKFGSKVGFAAPPRVHAGGAALLLLIH
jgi:hypothetical protein